MEKVHNPKTLYGLRVAQEIEDVLDKLSQGETVARFEYGTSMEPIFQSGQYARLTKLREMPKAGDAVFCKVDGVWMTHMVWICNNATGKCLIGNTHGEIYGWAEEVLAKATPMPFIESEEE